MKFADIAPPPIFWHIESWLTSFVLNVILRSVAFVYAFYVSAGKHEKLRTPGDYGIRKNPICQFCSCATTCHL